MFRALNGEMCDIGDEIRFCHGSENVEAPLKQK